MPRCVNEDGSTQMGSSPSIFDRLPVKNDQVGERLPDAECWQRRGEWLSWHVGRSLYESVPVMPREVLRRLGRMRRARTVLQPPRQCLKCLNGMHPGGDADNALRIDAHPSSFVEWIATHQAQRERDMLGVAPLNQAASRAWLDVGRHDQFSRKTPVAEGTPNESLLAWFDVELPQERLLDAACSGVIPIERAGDCRRATEAAACRRDHPVDRQACDHLSSASGLLLADQPLELIGAHDCGRQSAGQACGDGGCSGFCV